MTPAVATNLDPSAGRPDPDGNIFWYDGRLLTLEGRGWEQVASYYDRLPSHAEGVIPKAVWNFHNTSSGLCLRFTTDAESLKVRWTLQRKSLAMPHMPATGVSGVDLYARDASGTLRYVKTGRPTEPTNTATFTVPPSDGYVLYLPLYNGIASLEIGIPRERHIAPAAVSPRRQGRTIVFYGTSITQGGCASRPGMACSAIVGRALEAPVINLGFSGSGKMEPSMATLLAELNPAVYVLDCLWNMKPDMVSERVAPFVEALRAARPDTPIVLAEDSNVHNRVPTKKGQLLRSIIADLKARKVGGLYFVSADGMLGSDGEGTVDGVHHTDLGMMRQARVFIEALRPLLPSEQ